MRLWTARCSPCPARSLPLSSHSPGLIITYSTPTPAPRAAATDLRSGKPRPRLTPACPCPLGHPCSVCILQCHPSPSLSPFLLSLFPLRPLPSHPHFLLLPCLATPTPSTCIAQGGIFIQGKERWVQQHRVVILHDDALVFRLDPWLVLVGWPHPRGEQRKGPSVACKQGGLHSHPSPGLTRKPPPQYHCPL